MNRFQTVALLFAFASFVSGSAAADKDKPLRVGDPAPAWQDLPGTDGKTHSLADLKGKDVLVVAFTCNSCPYAVAYEDRLIDFARRHAGPDAKVALVAVNVNTKPDDRLPKMKERARKKGFPFVYLYDPSQQIARAFGATRTPEFFVLDKGRKLVYRGAMDDRTDPAEVKNRYLESAVEAALTGGKLDRAETPAVGCMILYNRKRDDRD